MATTCWPFCFGLEDVTEESDHPVAEGRAVMVAAWPGLGRLGCGLLPPLTAARPPGSLCKGPTRPAALGSRRAPVALYGSPSILVCPRLVLRGRGAHAERTLLCRRQRPSSDWKNTTFWWKDPKPNSSEL